MWRSELPHVVPYEALDQKAVPELISKLTNEGLHVSPEEKTAGTTMETILNKGLAEKEKMLATTKPATAPAPNNAPPHSSNSTVLDGKPTVGDKKPISDDKKITTDDKTKTKTPVEGKLASPVEKGNSGTKLAVGAMGLTFGILPWIL
ncbi:hypothetical protein EC968_000585 [Mortierella alpina]|nr:hypothetical protein EC968_000585 [Mortierella alpina]